ncbi:hypothetical protein [Actinoplanes sp. G11-F43]|uniref:hypothetical protein n=1 Tax=Actinoplanes sp. G11-F43 TaxID=3424130 RepID=UPI003D32663F
MKVNAANPSDWNDTYAAHSRLAAARAKLVADQIPTAAHPAVITADRAAVVVAEAELARIEATRANENSRFQRSGRFMDVYA